MAESFYGGRAGHDFTIYYCYSSSHEMKEDFKKINSHTPIGGYCLDTNGNLYRRMINNEALSLGNAAMMGIKDLQNTFLYRDGANIRLLPTNNIPTKILTMEGSSFAYCGISGGTDISVSMADNKIKINHNSKSFTPTTSTETLSYGSGFEVPILGYDAQGHISSKLTKTYKLPAAVSYSAGGGLTLSGTTFSLGGDNTVTLPLTIKGNIQTRSWIKLDDSIQILPKKVQKNASYCIDWMLSKDISLAKDNKLRIYSSDIDGFLAEQWTHTTKDEKTPFIILRSGTELQIIPAASQWGTPSGSGWYFTDFETKSGCYTTLILTAPKEISNVTSMSLILPTDNEYVNTELQTRSNAYLGTKESVQTVTLLKIDEYGKTTFYDYDS